jgi:spore coat polysaccharide biosynthesis protein SpsF
MYYSFDKFKMSEKNIAIIIQARTGSTRMPFKVVLPFYRNKTILDIIITKLKSKFNYPVIVATTDLIQDDCIEKIALENNVSCFRGDEKNVLKRFVDCAEHFNVSTIVRVCADNPFLDSEFLSEIIIEHVKSGADYTSYCTKKRTPVIKTHYGVFCEVVEKKSLKKVLIDTNDVFYLEHVTNYIYGNADSFRINLLLIPEYLEKYSIRLTLDSKEDWDILKQLYSTCIESYNNFDTKSLVNLLKEDVNKLNIMKQQIEKYSK